MSTEKICTCSENTKCPATCKGKKRAALPPPTKSELIVKCDECRCRSGACPSSCLPQVSSVIPCSASKQENLNENLTEDENKNDVTCICPEGRCKPTCKKFLNNVCDDCQNPENDCNKPCEEKKLVKAKSTPAICEDCQNPEDNCLVPCEEKKRSKQKLKAEISKSAPTIICDDCQNPEPTCQLECEEKKKAKVVEICDKCTNTEPTCPQPCEEKKAKAPKVCTDCTNTEHTCNDPCEENKASKNEMIVCSDCTNPEPTCNELCEENKATKNKSQSQPKLCKDPKCPKKMGKNIEKMEEKPPKKSNNCVPECATINETPVCAICDCNAGCNELCLKANADKTHSTSDLCENCDCNAGCSEECEKKKAKS